MVLDATVALVDIRYPTDINVYWWSVKYFGNNNQYTNNVVIASKTASLASRNPHVRPIVRGKVGTPVEFGSKPSVSCINGKVFLDHLSWDNFNESVDLPTQVELFRNRFGHYPESVHVDQSCSSGLFFSGFLCFCFARSSFFFIL